MDPPQIQPQLNATSLNRMQQHFGIHHHLQMNPQSSPNTHHHRNIEINAPHIVDINQKLNNKISMHSADILPARTFICICENIYLYLLKP